jgi:hypothetical protein
VGKSVDDLLAARNVLHLNIQLFDAGNTDCYRVVAGELRKLLCDTQRGNDNSLVTRLFPKARLHPLLGRLPPELMDKLVFMIPSSMHFSSEKGTCTVEKLFDETAEPLSIRDWLAQPLFNNRITIGELIRSVADKLDAHSDEKFGPTLTMSNRILLIDEPLHIQHVVAIGRYILKVLDEVAIASNESLKQRAAAKHQKRSQP